MKGDRYRQHVHDCRTEGCPNFYLCRSEQCRDDWRCPSCEDAELLHDIETQANEQERHREH